MRCLSNAIIEGSEQGTTRSTEYFRKTSNTALPSNLIIGIIGEVMNCCDVPGFQGRGAHVEGRGMHNLASPAKGPYDRQENAHVVAQTPIHSR